MYYVYIKIIVVHNSNNSNMQIIKRNMGYIKYKIEILVVYIC